MKITMPGCGGHGCEDREFHLLTVEEAPFDHFPSHAEGGPLLIPHGEWSALTNAVSNDLLDRGPTRLDIVKITRDGVTGDVHPLNGTVYPTGREAHRAGYEAGLFAFYVPGTDAKKNGL